MQDILKALDTLTNDELEAVIGRAEAILQERVRKGPLEEDPAIGMWADRPWHPLVIQGAYEAGEAGPK